MYISRYSLNFYYVLTAINCVVLFLLLCCFFFKQKTAYEMRISDWSSDVCSSDLKSRSSRGRSNSLWPEATAAATRHLPLRGGKSGRHWLHRPLLREGQRADRNDL